MKQIKNTARSLLFIASIIFLVGCSLQVGGEPTPDAKLIRTEAAQTVVAQMKTSAALQPATPTFTLAPTTTRTPVLTPATLTPSPTVVSLLPTALGGLFPTPTGLFPTRPTETSTPRYVGSYSEPTYTRTPMADEGVLVSQWPPDGTVMNRGQDFDAKWVIRNNRLSVWNTSYYYKYVSGTKMNNVADMYYIPYPVNPSGTVDLVVDMIAPNEPGRYTANWVLINNNGEAFFRFYIYIFVK